MKLRQLFAFLVLLTLLLKVYSQVSFTVSSSSVSPNTARSSSSQYTILLNAITTFSTTFDLSITFTSAFVLSTVSSCQLYINNNLVTSALCALTSSSNQITFTSINNTQTIKNMTLYFNSATALYSGTFIASLNYYLPATPSNSYGTNSAPISIINAALTCNMASTSNLVGATSNFTLSYSPSVFISPGSIVQVQFPPWSTYSLTNFPSFTSSAVCSGACTIRSPNQAQGFFNEVLTYSSLYPSTSTANMSLLMVNGRNPATTQPISLTITLLYYLSSTSQPSFMSCTTSLSASTPNQFQGVTFTPSSLTLSSASTINLFLNLTNPVSSITYLSVTYASDLSLSYSYVGSNQATTQSLISSGVSYNFLIGNLTSSTNLFTALFLQSFTFTNAPFANYPVSVTFQTQNLVGTTYYPIDTMTLSYQFTTASITNASVIATVYSIDTVSNYTFTFISINALVSNSKIVLTLPGEVLMTNTTLCTCSVSSTCSTMNSTSILINLNTMVAAGGSAFSITIYNIINPPTTTPSSSFALSTYYYNTSTPTDVLSVAVTITATSVSLFSGSVSSLSGVVVANSTYTITFKNKNNLPSGSYVQISFPLTSFSNSIGAALSSFQIAGVTSASCTMTAKSTMVFQFKSCITSAISPQTTITVSITNIINPTSTKPTNSMSIETYYNNLLMEYLYTGLSVTLTTATQLSSVSATPSSLIVNQVTSYSFGITFTQSYSSGSRVIITFPSSLTINSGFICSTSTSGLSVSCFQSPSLILAITLTTTGSIPSSVTISVSNIQNAWYVQTVSFGIQTTTNDAIYYYMEQGAATTILQTATLAASYTPNNQLVLLSASTILLVITNPFAVSAPNTTLLQMMMTVPSQLTLTNTTCQTSLSGVLCTKTSSNVITLSSLSSFSNTINVTFSCVAGYFSTTSDFSIALSYNNAGISSNNALTVSSFCQSPCQGCTSTSSQCTSCLPITYTTYTYLFTVNNSCVSSCPNTYYVGNNSSICQSCNSSACLWCVTTANTCTSCSNPKYLMNSSCLSACPNTYYGSNNICNVCINQCYNCTNATYCLKCISGYSLTPANVCSLNCPAGYASISSICQLCTSTCLTCLGTTSACASCNSSYILYNNTCIQSCPVGYYLNLNNQCSNCVSPCRYCSTALICSSCVTSYFLYNGTECVSACPAGTFLYTSYCQSCNAICQTCLNTATNCTSCNSSLYYYLNNCYSNCPVPTYPYQGQCTTCVTPCATCLSGAFSCSSCVTNYYLLNQTCLTNCPSVGYLVMNGSCLSCPSNCLSCSTSITCSICATNYYSYQGSCLSQCPSTSPIIVSQTCNSCAYECATCSGSPDSCLTCRIYYFKYSYTCVQSCPASTFSDANSYTCDSSLSSKIVFFPVLITFFVIIVAVTIIKIFSRNTSFQTVITSISGWLEISISAYLLSLLFSSYLQVGLSYMLPQVLIILSFFAIAIGNIIHFRTNYNRLKQDEFVRKWRDINVNYIYFQIIRFLTLFSHNKFFRIIYSKIFHTLHLSMVARSHKNIFTISTIFTGYILFLSEIPLIVASFYLIYNKLLKDQIFYTSVECLVVCIISIVFSLIDIHKPEDYFEDTEFMETKRYLEKVNNQSLNKLEDQYRQKDQGSVDGQKMFASSGGKFVFSKRDPTSMNELLFEEASVVTDAHDTINKAAKILIQVGQDNIFSEKQQQIISPRSSIHSHKSKPKSSSKINIFEPIQEEEAEYYEILKYEEQDFKTAAKLEEEKVEGNESEEECQLQIQRKQDFGVQTMQNDDNISLMEYRQRRQKWNNIIEHRQNLSHQIFNTIDTKQLKQLEKIDDHYEEQEQYDIEQEENKNSKNHFYHKNEKKGKVYRDIGQVNQIRDIKIQMKEEEVQHDLNLKKKRRKRDKKNNKGLEEIYLQRLAQKVKDNKKKMPNNVSYKSFKYEF